MALFKNKRYTNDLYTIIGEPADRERVASALEWLRSPAADGLGEQLLQRAKRLRQQPLTIYAGSDESYYRGNEHKIGIDIDTAADPTSTCIEASLAHELTHAADPTAYADHRWPKKWKPTLNAIISSAIRNAVGNVSKEEIELLARRVKEAPDYETACAALEVYVDHHMAIMKKVEDNIVAHVHRDPQYVTYVTMHEQPSMDAENKIYRRLGMPERQFYFDTKKAPSNERAREFFITLGKRDFQINFKPGGPLASYGQPIDQTIDLQKPDEKKSAVDGSSADHPSACANTIAHQGICDPTSGRNK